jgi:hypothetical protein
VLYIDPLGLYEVSYGGITKKPTPMPEAICGSTYACSKVGAAVYCHCDCVGGYVWASATVTVGGEMAYYSGPYGTLKKNPKDTTVNDAASAIAHEYNFQIYPAVYAADALLKQLEATAFSSDKECLAECSIVSMKVKKIFSDTLKQTQAAENK